MTRPKRNIVEYAAILTQRDLALSAAIEIVKNRLRHPVPSDGAEVVDANNSWRRDSARRSRHGKVIVRKDEAGGYPTTCRNRREAKFSRQRADGRASFRSFHSVRVCVSGRIHFELVKSTIVRPFLGTPAKKICAMTKAATGKVIVADFGNQVWFQRLPFC